MPDPASRERELLNHYGLTTLYPTEWPHEADADDESDEEEEELANPLGRAGSMLRKTYTSKYDREHGVVQRDEADPLGKTSSIAGVLRERSVPIEGNLKLRNRFMMSSTSFSPTGFLSQAHGDGQNHELLRGLDTLSRTIDQKSASLKVLVESNFEKFVRAKATIDNVYGEMRSAGVDPRESQAGARHSRHASKNSQTHFRNHSGAFGSQSKIVLGNGKKGTALTRESEFGVLGIKAPLHNLTIKTEKVWGPALGGRDKEESSKNVLNGMDQSKDIFRLPKIMQDHIRKNDYASVVEDHRKAKKYVDEAKNISDIAKANNMELGDADTQQVVLTAGMWRSVSVIIRDFERETWRKLRNSHGRRPASVTEEGDREAHMELISTLLQLNVDENPIWVWLNSRYLYLRDKIARTFERSRIEIEILRRRLANTEKDDAKSLARYLRSAAVMTGPFRLHTVTAEIDSQAITAFWEKFQFSINSLLSSRDGLLGEVLEFWDIAQSFIENRAQTAFPSAVFATGLEHLQLEPEEVSGLQSGTAELISVIRDNVLAFFTKPPVQDLNDLYSPIPPTPATPESSFAKSPLPQSPGNGALSPTSALQSGAKRSFSFDPMTVPPPSLNRGDPWEQYAFWPPQSNTLSASHYLSRILIAVGTAANDMGATSISQRGQTIESLKSLVNSVREQCVAAVCASWSIDAERCKYMEQWIRSADRRDLTNMPKTFMAFEEKVLQNMNKIAYISEATGTKGNAEVVLPPPTKLLQSIRSSFVTSLYKALSGMVENAEKLKPDSSGVNDPDGVTQPQRGVISSSEGSVESAVDFSNKNVRKLMTLSNLAHLRSDIIPHLVSQFETAFAVKLTDESKTIRDVLSQIDSRLFQSYVRPTVDHLSAIVQAGITDPEWVPPGSGPSNARPYVYDVLLALVLVHSEVTATASALTNQILSYLLEQISLALIAAFRTRSRYTLPALMQATLDVEFMAQTLNNYTTDRAGEVQSQIYLALDERTDDEARKQLQGELPAMRTILKQLREATKGEFGCFKKERRGRDRGGVVRG